MGLFWVLRCLRIRLIAHFRFPHESLGCLKSAHHLPGAHSLGSFSMEGKLPQVYHLVSFLLPCHIGPLKQFSQNSRDCSTALKFFALQTGNSSLLIIYEHAAITPSGLLCWKPWRLKNFVCIRLVTLTAITVSKTQNVIFCVLVLSSQPQSRHILSDLSALLNSFSMHHLLP